MFVAMIAMELSLRSDDDNGSKPPAGEVLGRLAREVDNFLTTWIDGDSFITAFFALYDEHEEALVTLNLEHLHVLAYLATSGKVPRLCGNEEQHLPLMASPYVPSDLANGMDPHPWPLRSPPGDALVSYTNHLVEVWNRKGEYGIKRLRQ